MRLAVPVEPRVPSTPFARPYQAETLPGRNLEGRRLFHKAFVRNSIRF